MKRDYKNGGSMSFKKWFYALAIAAVIAGGWIGLEPARGQDSSFVEDAEDRPLFRVEVDLVVLNVAVTDRRGRYINDLKPNDFQVLEDGIGQTLATFGEGNAAPIRVEEYGSRETGAPGKRYSRLSRPSGAPDRRELRRDERLRPL